MGGKIKAIKARFASIQGQTSELKLVERNLPVETPFTDKRRRQTHSFVDKEEIIGRDGDKAALLELLLEKEFQSEENVIMVKDHFELKMWVCVSDIFDVKTIVANIIKSATNQAPNQNLETDQLQTQLRDKIDGKKYLFVLDDIWNEEGEQWFSLKKLLMGGARGSRIIVTTRSHRVAKVTSKCQSYVLEGLSDDDAWSLFKKIAFEQRDADSTNPVFLEIGTQILERCGGVPLVIRTIASTLFIKETEREWRSFKDNELARISRKDGEILPTLKLSYDHLPAHLKHCFAYCRLYPKDHKINIQTLVQLWIAQGFVKQSDPNQSLQEIGLDYFKDLAERSFFQEMEEHDYWGMRCKMHDLMHDLAESVAGRESRILDSNSNTSEVDEICRHITIDFQIFPSFKGRKLRTLLPFPYQKNRNRSETIWNLIISNWKIEKLVNLTHLSCLDCRSLTHMPRGIGKLTSLQRLSMFVVDERGSRGGGGYAADLRELGGLNNLRGQLRITNLGLVKNAKEEFRAANLKEKQHLESLVLDWGYTTDDEEKSLEDLQPPPNLKRLSFFGWRGNAKIPSWLSLLTNLEFLSIRGGPRLAERCRKDIGEDWHKITHIPRIRVNGRQVQFLK
ncbi:disease resistance protein RGA2-like [Hibiscus syriacus]|uniref:disease resistance protein RGA2-like n=1 Tax=Hibiscus syriacus TaxID=106335 RepID=UPI0019233825|nr:disease resistance protein RGA2-like [Hibiscus syriacus]